MVMLSAYETFVSKTTWRERGRSSDGWANSLPERSRLRLPLLSWLFHQFICSACSWIYSTSTTPSCSGTWCFISPLCCLPCCLAISIRSPSRLTARKLIVAQQAASHHPSLVGQPSAWLPDEALSSSWRTLGRRWCASYLTNLARFTWIWSFAETSGALSLCIPENVSSLVFIMEEVHMSGGCREGGGRRRCRIRDPLCGCPVCTAFDAHDCRVLLTDREVRDP